MFEECSRACLKNVPGDMLENVPEDDSKSILEKLCYLVYGRKVKFPELLRKRKCQGQGKFPGEDSRVQGKFQVLYPKFALYSTILTRKFALSSAFPYLQEFRKFDLSSSVVSVLFTGPSLMTLIFTEKFYP